MYCALHVTTGLTSPCLLNGATAREFALHSSSLRCSHYLPAAVDGASNDQNDISCLLSPDSDTADLSESHFDFAEKLPDVHSSEAPATAATK